MPSLLLDLPTELRHRVYDALEIDDRIRLNAALPREDRITRTMRTDAKRDRTLGVVARFMKRRHVPFRELEGKIRMFVRENGDDPTIARLFPEVGPPDVSGGTHRARFMEALRANDAEAIADEARTPAPPEVDREFSVAIWQSAPATFDAVLERRIPGFVCDKQAVFNVVNHRNGPLLDHLADMASTHAFARDGLHHVAMPHIASIFADTNSCESVRVLLRLGRRWLTDDALSAMLESAMRSMNVDAADLLLAFDVNNPQTA